MYFSIRLPHRRTSDTPYRLQPSKTRKLRNREDYPHKTGTSASGSASAAQSGSGPSLFFSRRLRSLIGCIALTAVLLAGIYAAIGSNGAVGCREEDFGPITQTTAAAEETDGPKTVYLTFDDGPSENTEKVLSILKEAQVPATFFVIAAENNEEYLPVLEQTLEDGHCIGLHTCTHEYRKIYASAEAYWTDIEALKAKLKPYCGDYKFSVLRFPGGSTNTVSHKYGGSGLMDTLIEQAGKNGYSIVDWNVSAEDSVGGNPSANTIASRVIKGCKGKNSAIVLMHDSSTNSASAEALPTIIAWLKENNYTFDTVDHWTPPTTQSAKTSADSTVSSSSSSPASQSDTSSQPQD